MYSNSGVYVLPQAKKHNQTNKATIHTKQKSDYLFFGHKKISNFSMKYKTAESDYIFLLHLSVQVIFFYKIQQHNFFSEKKPIHCSLLLSLLKWSFPKWLIGHTHIFYFKSKGVSYKCTCMCQKFKNFICSELQMHYKQSHMY